MAGSLETRVIILTRLRRIAIRLAGLLIVLLLIAAGVVYALSERTLRRTYQIADESFTIPTDDVAVQRGRHLVEHQYVCAECHGADYGGKLFMDAGPIVARIAAPNITRGNGGVAARYTDRDWIRTLRHAVSPDGRSLLIMPSQHFAGATAGDLAAAIAYLKTLPPVDRVSDTREIGPMGRLLIALNPGEVVPATVIDHARPAPAAVPTELVARGQYLANTSGCNGCHKPDFTGGGGPPPGASNITPVGLGAWTQDDFLRAIRSHRTPDGRQLAEEMPLAYGQMADEDLAAIWAYLRTVPPKGEKRPRQMAAVNGAAVPRAN